MMAKEGFLLIDKPAGMTSHDVIDRLRRITGIRRIGHAGTLDPFATGLLLVGIGRSATKEMQNLVGLDKEYEAVFVLGARSDTDDVEGEIERLQVTGDRLQTQEIKKVMKKFVGEIEQIPPSYSAIKVKGKKMYEAARAGKPIEAKPRQVRIDSFELVDYDWPELRTIIRCGSGTYIRALARDLGNMLGVGGYVKELRRTKVGPFLISDTKTLEKLEHDIWPNFLIPVETALKAIGTGKSS
jgi:tRNA pseudouridine55 synthase